MVKKSIGREKDLIAQLKVRERKLATLLIHLGVAQDECPGLEPFITAVKGLHEGNVKHEARKIAGILNSSLLEEVERRRAKEKELRDELAKIRGRLRDVHGYTRYEPGFWRYIQWRFSGVKFWLSREDDF